METYLTQIGINPQNDVAKIWNYDSSDGWKSYVPGGDNSGSSRFEQFEANQGLLVSYEFIRDQLICLMHIIHTVFSCWKRLEVGWFEFIPIGSFGF